MGAMTQGVIAGIEAYQKGKELEEQKTLRERQAVLGGIKTLNEIMEMPPNLRKVMLNQFGPDIQRTTGQFIHPTTMKMMEKMDEEQTALFKEAISEAGLTLEPSAVMNLFKNPYEGLKWIKEYAAGKRGREKEQAVSTILGEDLMPERQGTPAREPVRMPDTTLRSGLAGQALGAPADQPAAEGAVLIPGQPAQPAPQLTPKDEIAYLDQVAARLQDQARRAGMAAGGMSDELHRQFTFQQAAIDKRRHYLEQQVKGEEGQLKEVPGPGGVPQLVRVSPRFGGPAAEVAFTGTAQPLTDLAKHIADRNRLQAGGLGVDHPDVKALQDKIASMGGNNDPAQSPVGKLLKDLETNERVYGKNSPQATIVREQIDELRTGGQITQSDVHNFRAEFSRASQNYVAVKDAWARIQSVAAEESQAGDLALLTSYMKMIDPTTGVREGELTTASGAGSIPERIKAAWNRLMTTKGRLSTEMRDDFVRQAKNLYLSHERSQLALEEEFTDKAKRQRMDPKQIIIDYKKGAFGESYQDNERGARGRAEDARQGAIGATKSLLKELEGGPSPSKRR